MGPVNRAPSDVPGDATAGAFAANSPTRSGVCRSSNQVSVRPPRRRPTALRGPRPAEARVLVAFAGIVLVAPGIIMAVTGFTSEFTRQLRMGWMSRGTQDLVVRLGQAGYGARALIVAAIGIAALDAAITCSAAKAEASTGCSAHSPRQHSVRGCSSSSHSG